MTPRKGEQWLWLRRDGNVTSVTVIAARGEIRVRADVSGYVWSVKPAHVGKRLIPTGDTVPPAV